ncbi:HigA family addiction module antitoxin [Bifidobacterium amazonense]|uniref:HigA family addiction module antitoxin n=1 Tax=Bifidobacterium amazonense TaxID=2809027 RepID=A0ABS9VV28_9BIFI|nr:HigA family addiction module antitoxin [Bifidobacterium amazonense]MCH9275809.1 HigA family addiction module antitoxin [Bifidobacterium amazonense]
MSTSPTITTDRADAARPGAYLSTPGEILREEFLEPLHISNYRLAKTIGVSETAVGEIVNGKRRISVAMAYRLGKAFGTTPEFWMNLQRDWDVFTFDPSGIGDIKPLVGV